MQYTRIVSFNKIHLTYVNKKAHFTAMFKAINKFNEVPFHGSKIAFNSLWMSLYATLVVGVVKK